MSEKSDNKEIMAARYIKAVALFAELMGVLTPSSDELTIIKGMIKGIDAQPVDSPATEGK